MADAKVELIDIYKEFPVRVGESMAVRAVHNLNPTFMTANSLRCSVLAAAVKQRLCA
jgi:hypothetical protein